MSSNKRSTIKKQVIKEPEEVKVVEENVTLDSKKTKIVFSEDKFYNDLANPIFVAGKVYEIEGDDWIERWIKRGGTIVQNTAAPDSDKDIKVEETSSNEGVSAGKAKEDADNLY